MALYTITADETLSSPFLYKTNTKVESLQVDIIGSFGGGTVEIQKLYSDGVYRTIPGASFTSEVSKNFSIKNDSRIRYVVSGSTTPSLIIELL
jgi:hypothetical protein